MAMPGSGITLDSDVKHPPDQVSLTPVHMFLAGMIRTRAEKTKN